MSTLDEVTSRQGKTMVDAESHKIGTIEAIYLGPAHRRAVMGDRQAGAGPAS